MRRLISIITALPLFVGVADADNPRCPDLHLLGQHLKAAGTNAGQTLSDLSLAAQDQAPETCRTAVETTGPSAYCIWSLPFRSPDAHVLHDRLFGHFAACLGVQDADKDDARVNHPDSYGLSQLSGDGLTLSVAVKDKGALAQTLVFLRITATGKD